MGMEKDYYSIVQQAVASDPPDRQRRGAWRGCGRAAGRESSIIYIYKCIWEREARDKEKVREKGRRAAWRKKNYIGRGKRETETKSKLYCPACMLLIDVSLVW